MDWIRKIKTDENSALTEIYLLYRDECISWLQIEFTLDIQDASDVFQLSVVILYDNVITGKLTELSTDVKKYLYGIARNKSLELYREKKRLNIQDSNLLMNRYVQMENDSDIHEKEILENQISKMINCLHIMGDPCRSVLQLFYFNNMSMEEISYLMGYKNADTVKNQKYKCLKRLQKTFSEHIVINN
ncbi:MAG: sigma-70 family RNA polymerase sigma factor [Saprospiraceae bacterium]|nr:sigma-70 family RNA polymerase sigma factor [Saprospiraceae bacterium]